MLACLTDPTPHARLLSNGRYTVLLTGAGTGYSACDDCALTSWRGDRTEDGDGFFVYLRDLDRDTVWSVGRHPIARPADGYDARYQSGRVSIERRQQDVEARLEVCVAAEDDIEIRRVRLHNLSPRLCRIEVTSYVEVVLNHRSAHAAHPAFSKLFVQTEYVAEGNVLLARRRPRSRDERWPWLIHATVGSVGQVAVEYESDRARFIGRGRNPARPAALTTSLSGAVGNVLDPIFSLRRVVSIEPGQSVDLSFLLGVGPERGAVLDLAARYRDAPTIDGAFEGASARETALLRELKLSAERAEVWQELAGAMLYGDPTLRAGGEILLRARAPSAAEPAVASAFRRQGLAADGLLAVARIERIAELSAVRELLRCRAYWQRLGLGASLLILCGGDGALQDEVRRALAVDDAGVVVRSRHDVPPADLDLIEAAAHLVLSPERLEKFARGLPLLETPGGALHAKSSEPSLVIPAKAGIQGAGMPPPHLDTRLRGYDGVRWARSPTAKAFWPEPAPGEGPGGSFQFDNGYGGFTPDGNEYVIRLGGDGRRPPMPWINVIANETFGFLVSESGAGYTWSRNSRENRLTPWYNDPIGDPYGESLYLRDEGSGSVCSPLPGPIPAGGAYEVSHGFGYTRWRNEGDDLEQEVLQFVPRGDPVKVTRVRLTNRGAAPRRLSLFSYSRLVLGGLPTDSGRFVASELDSRSNSLFARNRCNNEFGDAVVFAAAVVPDGAEPLRFSGDRASFIGRNGSAAAPAAVVQTAALDGRTGAGLDPCAALQVTFTVAPGGTVECSFLLGEVTDDTAARALIDHCRRPGAIDKALAEVNAFWSETLSAVQVHTPAPAIDLMVNGWLLYQDLSCRLWARSAFYQSGGAFGFRDQLQDSAALVYSRPDLTRSQILLHAAHQFVEGDVLHWWHPPISRGIRTRFSDDLLWLPYIVAFYVRATDDWSVLDESAGFVTARPLAPGEDEAYLFPGTAGETADVYGHCCRALDRSLTRGVHGLPLMGTGDWNDGMNRVGREGRGESVWMGFFLYRIIEDFVPICERRGDHERARRYRAYQADLEMALNDSGWDGQWYRRAYYDDGTPLGSAQNEECRIDALAQAWAVISKAAPPERAAQALAAVEQQLVVSEPGLIRLLAPPFDRDPHDPGYIKGYVRGIRENGGQYTHAAVWVVQAFAELGRRDRAAALLEMLSPIHHTRTVAEVAGYQVEPYVVAADIYGVEPHVGRGGWTWYTGSAGWMYRVALESVLGIRIEGGRVLVFDPCVPDDWPEMRVTLRLPDGRTVYELVARNGAGSAAAVELVRVDGQPGVVENGAARIFLVADGKTHRVEVSLGPLPGDCP